MPVSTSLSDQLNNTCVGETGKTRDTNRDVARVVEQIGITE